MSTWLLVLLLFVTVVCPAAFALFPLFRAPHARQPVTLDFTTTRRRVPHTRRPPPERRGASVLGLRP